MLNLVGVHQPACAGDVEAHSTPSRGEQQVIQLDPRGRGNLRIERDLRPRGEKKYKGENRNRGQDRRAGHHRLQARHQIGRLKLNSYFLPRLSDRGFEEVAIEPVSATAWKGKMTRPGITGPLGAADQEDGIWIGNRDDGDGSPGATGIRGRATQGAN